MENVLGLRESPSIWKQASQRLRTRIYRELQDHVAQVGPRFEPMPLRPRDDRADHRRAATIPDRRSASCRSGAANRSKDYPEVISVGM